MPRGFDNQVPSSPAGEVMPAVANAPKPLTRAKSDRMVYARSMAGIGSIIVLALFAIVAAFFLTGLLALSLDGYWGYLAAIPEHGDQAAMNADEELFGVGVASFLLACLWLLVTWMAAAIAAGTELSVPRTAIVAGGGLLLVVGLYTCAWLSFGV